MSVLRTFLKTIWVEVRKDDLSRKAAAIAFYAVISFPSLLLILTTSAGWILGEQAVSQSLMAKAALYADFETLSFLHTTIENLRIERSGVFYGLAVFLFFLVSSVNVIHEIRYSLNAILKTKKRRLRWRNVAWGYALSFAILMMFVLLISAFVASDIILALIEGRIADQMLLPVHVLGIVNHALAYAGITAIFFVLFLLMPVERPKMLPAFLCSIITGSLIIIGTRILSFAVAAFDLGYAFGVAASLMILLLWLYYASFAFLLGGEILDVMTHKIDKLH